MLDTGEHEVVSDGARVVVIEDEGDIRGLIAFTLRQVGWEVHEASTGQEGIDRVCSVRPALVVLDLMLPDLSGVEVCRRLRSDPENRQMRIMMVTARSDEYDKLLGFEVGADDYVVKPFNVREISLRARALLRAREPRGAAWTGPPPFRWRGLMLDPMRYRVRADGVDVVLRPVEFRILRLVMANPGRTFTRLEVGAAIWSGPHTGSLRTVDTHISRLRDALGPYAGVIETVPGVGYRLGSER